jgi:ribosomal protein L11 methyltransferase
VIRLAVRVHREQAELVLADLLELAPGGVEEADAGEHVEYAVYGAPGELPSLPDLQAAAGAALVEVTTSEIADDWQERWRRFHRPVVIPSPAGGANRVPALVVRPPWEAPRDWLSREGSGSGDRGRDSAYAGAAQEIIIDPGQAFGTGAHASTRLCLELLLELAAQTPARGGLLDVGTGSGVLAIAAARLGFTPVVGLDNDRESVRAARANAAVNDVALTVRRRDLRRDALPASDDGRHPRQVVTANLLFGLLSDLARVLDPAPTHLIAGGLLAGQAEEVAASFSERLGLQVRERRARGEWEALWLALP